MYCRFLIPFPQREEKQRSLMEIFCSQNHLHCYCLQLREDENIKPQQFKFLKIAGLTNFILQEKISKLHLGCKVSTLQKCQKP